MEFTSVTLDRGLVATVTLDRPNTRNAFDDLLVKDLTLIAQVVSEDPEVRAVVLTGAGETFCAGADLHWMRAMADYTDEENREDGRRLAAMYQTIAESRKPWVARVNGHALGGGAGLVAACDLAVGVEGAKLGFTEIRLGILPAVIAPYVLRRIGWRNAQRYFLTGEIFDAALAREIGLLHLLAPSIEELDHQVTRLVKALLVAAPGGIGATKQLLAEMHDLPLKEAIPYTVETIARRRVSAEGQEGMRAFLQKRKPAWVAVLPPEWRED